MGKQREQGQAGKSAGALAVVKNAGAFYAEAARKLALPAVKIDKDYTIPLVRRDQVLWLEFKDKADPRKRTWVPYVTHRALVDALHQRGYRKLSCTPPMARPCREAGCYGAGPNDYQQVTTCTVVLKSGQELSLSGDACRHNTTSLISGNQRTRANAMARMSETRAIDRVLSRALNIGAAAIVELPQITDAQRWKQGDRIMAKGEVENIIDADFRADEGPTAEAAAGRQGANEQRAAEPRAVKEADESPEKQEAYRSIHVVLANVKAPTKGAHIVLAKIASQAFGRQVAGFRDMTAAELARAEAYVMKLTYGQLTRFLSECKAAEEAAK